MKAIRIHEFGGPQVLKYEDIPDPVLRRDHVLIRDPESDQIVRKVNRGLCQGGRGRGTAENEG